MSFYLVKTYNEPSEAIYADYFENSKEFITFHKILADHPTGKSSLFVKAIPVNQIKSFEFVYKEEE